MQKDKLQVESRPGSVPEHRVLRLSGSVTLDSCFDLQDLLRSDPSTFLILDMTAVRFVDSSGIGCLVNGYMAHHMDVNDRTRSMPFEELRPLLDVPGLKWQSLQYGEATEPPLVPLDAKDYLDTARAIARCELVITVDTSIAHLAGCMGVETWILLPHFAEWRWLQDRDDTPWYEAARLWRQPAAGDWHDLVVLVEDALRRRVGVRDE